MWKKLTYLVFLTGIALVQAKSAAIHKPFVDLPLKPLKTSADRIREHGYPAESHFVETVDGYVLNIFRLPYSPKRQNAGEKKPVVLIQHGLFSCSDCFILNGPDDSIVCNYADAGFDVWLGNARGNIYSRNNTKISLNHPNFWNFSWHEIGAIDMPAMIDYILQQTDQQSLHYVGHSQGGTVYFVMNSWLPEYNAKIRTAHLLAPAVFMGNATTGMVTSLAKYFGKPGANANLLSNQQFLPANPLVQRILDTACGRNPRFPEYCGTLWLMWGGEDQPNLNATTLPQLAETHPSGVSTNQGIHFLQTHLSNHFRRYDYGAKDNMKLYKQQTPPDYPLEKITADTYLYYGLADTSANAKDMKRLLDYLPNIKRFEEISVPTWGHLDFIVALSVKEFINDPVIEASLAYEREHSV